MNTLAIKWLNTDRTPCNGGTGRWHPPAGKRPGKWMPPVVRVVPCQSGYHACTPAQALEWCGPSAWLVEVRGDIIDHGDKLVAAQARLIRRLNWDDRTARLFAADCAERVLPIFEAAYPGDDRPRRTIEVARMFADGIATREELAAAQDAARAAARAAAQDAARAAARAAAWDAAWAAARDAARAAAWAAAWAAEREWQTARLLDVLGAVELAP